jgi:hypothetical protein
MASRVKQKEEARARRLAQEQAQLARAQRTRRMQMLGGVVLAAVIVAVVVIVISSSGGGVKASSVTGPRPLLKLGSSTALGPLQSPGSPGPLGPEGVPLPVAQPLAPAGSPGPGQSVDGISCQGGEQTLFHVHTHLTIFVNGSPRQIPYGVGIAPPRQVDQTGGGQFVASGACFSWLHTHAADGIIHIESPVQTTFTLGNFFDVWGQPSTTDSTTSATLAISQSVTTSRSSSTSAGRWLRPRRSTSHRRGFRAGCRRSAGRSALPSVNRRMMQS